MASVIEKFSDDIFLKIGNGTSLPMVCDWLAKEKGVSITKQSVSSWYTRKCKRILKRKQQQDGVLPLPLQSTNSHDPRASLNAFQKSLDTLIQEGERQVANPHTQYLVKPKQGGSENKASTPSKGVKK